MEWEEDTCDAESFIPTVDDDDGVVGIAEG